MQTITVNNQPERILMKTKPALAAPWWAALVFTFALTWHVPPALAASASPPETMSYQGFLVDGSGQALGLNAPKNYDVIFRIYNDKTGTAPANLLWTEQQTVTVDKGYFSVLLGEGSEVGSEPRPLLSALFRATDDVSDRFVEITVKGIGAGTPPADVTILPRLRLLTSPYAFLARNAVALVSGTNAVVSTLAGYVGINTANPSAQLDVKGNVQATGLNVTDGASIDTLDVTGSATATTLNVTGTATAASYAGNGAGLTNLSASQITSGTLSSARIPTTLAGDRTFSDRVSIGKTSAPEANLDVAGTVSMFQSPKLINLYTLIQPSWNWSGTNATDGFLSVVVTGEPGAGGTVEGRVGTNRLGIAKLPGASFMLPVPKGVTNSLSYSGGGTVYVYIYWTPLGR